MLRTSVRNLSMRGCWNCFFFIELKPILGFRVMPQYTYALSGTKDFFVIESNFKGILNEKWKGWRKATSAVIQCLEAKVEDIIVSTRSGDTASSGCL